MKAVVVANCQARPVSDLLGDMRPDLEMAEPVILHLSQAAHADRDLQALSGADLVFAQLTADGFLPGHLATSFLRQTFPGKVIVWPNIFYTGEQPYLRYFTHPQGGRMTGPFDASHDLRLYRSWLHDGRVDPGAVLHSAPELVASTARGSLLALRAREQLTDVAISDVIEENPGTEPLFFTFNHPRRALLAQLARRLLAVAGLAVVQPPPPRPEPLDRYRVPGIDGSGDFRGDAPGSRQPAAYDLPALAAAFQKVYEGDPRFQNPDTIRLTPLIGWERAFLARG